MMKMIFTRGMFANRRIVDGTFDCQGGIYCCQGYEVSFRLYSSSASGKLKETLTEFRRIGDDRECSMV